MVASYSSFEQYLSSRGRAPTTAKVYAVHARLLDVDDPVAAARAVLTSPDYAPKSKHAMLGAFRAWARYKGDDELEAALASGEIKLPAAVRVKPQVPLPPDVYRAIREEIDQADYISDPARACLGLMANRGLRRGDTLRLRRQDVTGALKTGVLSYVVKGGRRLEQGVLKSFRLYLELLSEQGSRWSSVDELVAKTPSAALAAIPLSLKRVASHVDLGDEVTLADVRCHVLRRSYVVTYWKACGKDITQLVAHMGWSNAATAYGYIDYVNRIELDDIADKMW